ncbi:M20/M25/M40 family metallo-hydrolase [Sphingobacterium psychroaquaticum]|uniref:M20/M25/M40 family metallo-hydrolase n=1 Tax=Sphingobacterium psychroaquaticum TaxID=561061 RepID=UPI001068DC58|nr:M20/M25/M40 family metallo-hydrolase [Sphingobacterium psychroaquaticum]QBQ39786.1 M20/M25/M40 family metallo-hydrolase [Sphingobacterium psychroaquaticum]
MNKKQVLSFLSCLATAYACMAQVSVAQSVDPTDVKRIIETLASDDMRGRASFTKDIDKAADFIANEFRQAGLKPYAEDNYRQTFHVTRITPGEQVVQVNHNNIQAQEFVVISASPQIQWTEKNNIEQLEIKKGEDFSMRFREIVRNNPNNNIVWVDPSFADMLARFKTIFSRENVTTKQDQDIAAGPSKVFILKQAAINSFNIQASTKRQDLPLFNVAAVIPGKSKADEFVVFSGHYDHLGVVTPVGQDSIANGADDDASGTTAMISLAKHFQKLDQNERTLIFVAFTAEEIGMFGSKYFSNNIDPDKVVAMINIEMIGKDSKFGPNSLYVTGYKNSNLAQLMQEQVKGTAFTFHPDPYPQQNLFYRSDNAVLAALGVPAHTFSTSQIDKDEYYHTVKDEVSTLNMNNINATIEAIATGVMGIIKGEQTPSRVEKLRD